MRIFRAAIVTFVLCVSAAKADPTQEAVMQRAHSHNDYEQARPLAEALDNKFGSVEADIFLVDGALLVAHTPRDCKPERTLESLYLAPLAARAKENDGRVYPNALKPLILLIDIKTAAEPTYAVLRKQLEKYETMFTHFTDKETKEGAVTVILSGNRPIETVKTEPERLCGIDGRMPDLAAGATASLYPLISDNWPTVFSWKGEGELPNKEKARLTMLVAQAHANGQLLRFWGLPDAPAVVWPVLFEAGVDLLNTDDLPKLRAFLLERGK